MFTQQHKRDLVNQLGAGESEYLRHISGKLRLVQRFKQLLGITGVVLSGVAVREHTFAARGGRGGGSAVQGSEELMSAN